LIVVLRQSSKSFAFLRAPDGDYTLVSNYAKQVRIDTARLSGKAALWFIEGFVVVAV
jgi:hypothetical protein